MNPLLKYRYIYTLSQKQTNIIDISIVIQQIIIESICLTIQFQLNLKLFHIVLIYFRGIISTTTHLIYVDPNFSTSHDYMVSEIIANHRLKVFLSTKIEVLTIKTANTNQEHIRDSLQNMHSTLHYANILDLKVSNHMIIFKEKY